MKSKVRRHVFEVRRHEIQCVYSIPHCLFPKGGLYITSPAPPQSHSNFVVFLQVPAGHQTKRLPDCSHWTDWPSGLSHPSIACCVVSQILLLLTVRPDLSPGHRNVDPPRHRPVVDCYFFFFPEYELVQMLVDMHFEQVYEGYPDVSLRGFWTSLRSVSLRRLVYVLFGVSLWTFYVLVYMDFGHVYGS